MTDEAFLAKLRTVNQGATADGDSISPSDWDSVDMLEMIAAIDESFSVTVSIERLKSCRTVSELRALIGQERAQ